MGLPQLPRFGGYPAAGAVLPAIDFGRAKLQARRSRGAALSEQSEPASAAAGGREAASEAKRREAHLFRTPGGAYLIFGHYSVTVARRMTVTFRQNAGHFAKIYRYPCGICDIVASTSPDFHGAGWEEAENYASPGRSAGAKPPRSRTEAQAEDLERSMRRARARVRRLALANDFRWFVTLTLDQQRVDRYDPAEVVRKLNQWASNQVKRKGLRYILVPERHKDGALHFHGFFSDALEATDSGHEDKAGRPIYNLPGWTLGFTAAIEVYGDYAGAVAYVCKYIGKQGEKPAGRWYYSGGALAEPETIYADIGIDDLVEAYGDRVWQTYVPGRKIAVINGIKE
jgi:hypothetical protein